MQVRQVVGRSFLLTLGDPGGLDIAGGTGCGVRVGGHGPSQKGKERVVTEDVEDGSEGSRGDGEEDAEGSEGEGSGGGDD